MTINKKLCKELKKRGTWKSIHCTMCRHGKKCEYTDYQENHE